MALRRHDPVHLLVNGRRPLLALLVLLTALLGVAASRVQFDNTIESYFLDADVVDYNAFLDVFGSDEIVALAFADDDVFSPASLALIDRISRALERLPHVRRVLSLTTVQTVHGTADQVEFSDLVDDLDAAATRHDLIRQRALADPFIPGTVVSKDGRRAAVVAEIDHLIGEFDYKVELLRQIRSLMRDVHADTGVRLRLAGTAVLDDALFSETQHDQQMFMPLMMALIIVVMALMFRSLRLLVLPVAIVVMTVIWTYGLLALLGFKINVVSTIIPPLLLAVAIADAMHIVADYLQEVTQADVSSEQALRQCFANVAWPCLLTSLTTVAGLLSLLVADLRPLREFGLVSACGVGFAYLITMALLPWLPRLVPAQHAARSDAMLGGFSARVLAVLGRWTPRRARLVIMTGTLATAVGVLALPQVGIGTNSLDFFRSDDPARRATQWIDNGIGGTTSLEFHIDGGHPGALKEPDVLERMRRFQRYLAGVDGVTGVYSLADLVCTLNRAFGDGNQQAYRIPADEAVIAQQLLLLEGSDDLRALTSDDFSQGRITARIQMDKSQRIAHAMPDIERHMREIFGPVEVRPTGLVYLMNRMEHYLLTSQIKSFVLAFIVIGAALFLLLRSWSLGLVATAPNLVPLVLTLGVMPLFGIRLDVGTVMIAAIVLGLIVDDTIHFLTRWEQEVMRGVDGRTAIASAMRGVGRPIVYTSVVLCAGFAVLTLASFNPVIHFGQLASLAIGLALLADLFLLPAMLGLVAPRLARRKTTGQGGRSGS